MDSNIVFNKDFDAASVFVMKVYHTDVSVIWNYFTKATLLDQWWAPRPWKCETHRMDFREGGTWDYAMVGPENEKQYAGAEYHEINFHRSFDCTDYFADANGNRDTILPSVKWLFGFTGVDEGTKLTINIHFNSEADMKKILEMGFEEGLKMGFSQLDEIINKKD